VSTRVLRLPLPGCMLPVILGGKHAAEDSRFTSRKRGESDKEGTVALAADIICCRNPCSGILADDRTDSTNSTDEVRVRVDDDQIDDPNGADILHGDRGKAYRSAAT
jgi:hypothetical protein